MNLTEILNFELKYLFVHPRILIKSMFRFIIPSKTEFYIDNNYIDSNFRMNFYIFAFNKAPFFKLKY